MVMRLGVYLYIFSDLGVKSTPPHNKNVLGQNFSFVSALGRAAFW